MKGTGEVGRHRERGFYLLDGTPADLVEFTVALLQAVLTERQHARAVDPAFHAQMDRLGTRLRAWIVREHGSGPHYVKAKPMQRRKAAIAAGLQRGDSLEDIFADAGVSRAHGYRILGMVDKGGS